MSTTTASRPFQKGTIIAVLAALMFGLTAPFIKLAGSALGPFSTAALLYLGALLVSAPALRGRHDDKGPAVRGRDAWRIIGIAIFGAALAPAALAWGLQRTSAASASLLLNTEALFTVLLARIAYREHVGRRAVLALLLIAGGAASIVGGTAWRPSWGGVAVVCAALAWGIDNTIGRTLADRSPAQVVFWKSAAGVVATLLVAAALREPLPSLGAAGALMALGASGYGLSLRLYLEAQRRLGAGRTGSIFACGPFFGAIVAVAVGEPWPGARGWAAAALLIAGLYLHLSERHGHLHAHEALEHEHAHTHDDDHHDHVHEPGVVGPHSHMHRHGAVEHDHPHAPDLHHRHRH